MSRTLTISDELYGQLEAEARQRGLPGVEQLLELMASRESQHAEPE